MQNNQMINLAIMGIGTIGKRHLMAINAIENVNLCGIVDLTKEARSFCNDNKISLFDDLNELKKSTKVDGVIISTPTIMHHENAISALNLGLDVLIEKPISATSSEAEQIEKIAQLNNCSVLVGHQRRFNPIVLKTKEIILEKKIGNVIGLSGIWALRKDDDYFLPEWRKETSAGPVITNLIHDIDYLRFIFGEITEVSAFSSNNINNFEKEDILSTNLKFEQGLIGNFLISDSGTSPWSWETGTGENIHLPYLKENNLRIVGTQGSLEFPNLKLWTYKNGGDNWKSELESFNYDFDEVDPYTSQINHFIDVINKKVDPITNASDAKSTLKVALAILESAKLNSIIKV